MPTRIKLTKLTPKIQRQIENAGRAAEKKVQLMLPNAVSTGKAKGHDFVLSNGKKVEVKSVNGMGVALRLEKIDDGVLAWRNNDAHHVVLVHNNYFHFVSAEKLRNAILAFKLTGAEGTYKFTIAEIKPHLKTWHKTLLASPAGPAVLNKYFGTRVA
jgi:hypothetical protein